MRVKVERDTLLRAARFGVVGVASTAIHVAVAMLLVEYFRWHPSPANGLAVVCATIFSYLVNTVWSFSASLQLKTLLRFAVVSAGIALLASSVAAIAEWAGVDYRVGIAIVIIVIPPVTFLCHHSWTYRADHA